MSDKRDLRAELEQEAEKSGAQTPLAMRLLRQEELGQVVGGIAHSQSGGSYTQGSGSGAYGQSGGSFTQSGGSYAQSRGVIVRQP